MDTRLLGFIKTDLKLARTMLRLAAAAMASPADPDGAVRAINQARTALNAVRRLLPKVNLPQTERASIERALVDLEAELRASPDN